MIRRCDDRDFDLIWAIINDGAQAYKGIIPADCWTDPYMSREKLRHEIDEGVVFWGYEQTGVLEGVMGIQEVLDVTLIRHAYVRTSSQKQGLEGACCLICWSWQAARYKSGRGRTLAGPSISTKDTAFNS